MTLSITETDGTKRTMQGAIDHISIDMETNTLSMKVIGIRDQFTFTIKDKVTITEERTF